jgi:hypothetical protein
MDKAGDIQEAKTAHTMAQQLIGWCCIDRLSWQN